MVSGKGRLGKRGEAYERSIDKIVYMCMCFCCVCVSVCMLACMHLLRHQHPRLTVKMLICTEQPSLQASWIILPLEQVLAQVNQCGNWLQWPPHFRPIHTHACSIPQKRSGNNICSVLREGLRRCNVPRNKCLR